jgi:hypothetical protein
VPEIWQTHPDDSDLLMGSIYYRSQVALVTGWIHHIVYVFIVQVCIKRAWTQIFCLCALMEVRYSRISPLRSLTISPSSYQPSFWRSLPYTHVYDPTSHLQWLSSSLVSYSTSSGVSRISFPPTAYTPQEARYCLRLCWLVYFHYTRFGSEGA